MSLLDDLATAPDFVDLPEGEEERAAFRIDGPHTATWAMRKLRDVQRRRAEIQTTAEREINRVQDWAAREDAKHARDADYFTSLLTVYALAQRAESGGRAKSVTTPYGTVTTRQKRGAWTVDEAAVLAWARVHRPEIVKVAESLLLGEAKKVLAVEENWVIDPASGEVVDGISVAPDSLTATVSVDLTVEPVEIERAG